MLINYMVNGGLKIWARCGAEGRFLGGGLIQNSWRRRRKCVGAGWRRRDRDGGIMTNVNEETGERELVSQKNGQRVTRTRDRVVYELDEGYAQRCNIFTRHRARRS